MKQVCQIVVELDRQLASEDGLELYAKSDFVGFVGVEEATVGVLFDERSRPGLVAWEPDHFGGELGDVRLGKNVVVMAEDHFVKGVVGRAIGVGHD